ncbi:MAG: CAP domain-containing protein [Candidatus Kapabacteria bacterium]|nr:CAP domain-containing protein [Candidatus Kapabacteria bacterium]
MCTYRVLAVLIIFTIKVSAQGQADELRSWFQPDRFIEHSQADEQSIIGVLNSLRTSPQSWARLIDTMILWLEVGRPPRMLQHLLGSEGASLLQEVRIFLDTVSAACAVSRSTCLQRVASLHAVDVSSNPGRVRHTSSAGATLTQRVRNACPDVTSFAECIDHLSANASTVILRLLFDPDVPDRGHRRTLFDPEFRSVGVGGAPCKNHPILGTGYVVVLTFADRR